MALLCCCSCRPQAVPLLLVSSKPSATSPTICRNGFGSSVAEDGSSDGERAELVGRTSSAMPRIRKAACAVASAVVSCASAALVWSLPVLMPDMAMAEAAYTPYAQSERLQIGLLNGRIRLCPLDINPNCVSTSSSNQAYAFPWEIPLSSSTTALKKIESAITTTQKNAQILKVEDVFDGKRSGKYLVAEVDGFLGRDTLEFLVRDDVVTYRSMANKVKYLYPFTTPIGDFGAQQKHIKALEDELGWAVPDFDTIK